MNQLILLTQSASVNSRNASATFQPESIPAGSALLALMSLALCWAVKTGEWLHQHQPLQRKKHGRLAKSIFRYGFDYLRSLVCDLDLNSHEFVHSLQFLSCT